MAVGVRVQLHHIGAILLRRFLRRNPPTNCRLCPLKAAIGGVIAFGLIALMAEFTGDLLLIAPLAASAVLVFAAPDSPMAQPANVVGGHVLAALLGLLLEMILPGGWWSAALGIGMVILAMSMARIVHPPAGATAWVVLTVHPGWDYVFFPVLGGSVAIVFTAVLLHRLVPPRGNYPHH